MQRNFIEKRRRRPSYIVPLIFFGLELLLMFLLISLFNWEINPLQWNVYSYPIFLIWIIYISAKLYLVLRRQKRS